MADLKMVNRMVPGGGTGIMPPLEHLFFGAGTVATFDLLERRATG